MTRLFFLQKIEPKLLIEKQENTSHDNICFFMDEGMLIIGKHRLINNVPNIIEINELNFYRASVYELVETTFPDNIEEECQFSYKVPFFFIKIFNK